MCVSTVLARTAVHRDLGVLPGSPLGHLHILVHMGSYGDPDDPAQLLSERSLPDPLYRSLTEDLVEIWVRSSVHEELSDAMG